jgi:hypothetical protein
MHLPYQNQVLHQIPLGMHLLQLLLQYLLWTTPEPILATCLAETFKRGLAILAILAAIAAVPISELPPVKGAAAKPAIPPAIDKPTSVTILLNDGEDKNDSVSLLYFPLSASLNTSIHLQVL